MLNLRGEDRADYFHVICADCGQHVHLTFLGSFAAPRVHAECRKCGTEKDQKLMAPYWRGLPKDPA